VASDSTSSPSEWRAAPPRPAVVLASRAVPATAEQLQQEAEAVANQLRDRFPNLAQALHVVAMLDAQLRQTAKAEELWRKCIELDPKEVRYYVNLAAVAMDRGNSESAVQTLEQAIDAGCSSPDV
jgi:tetratricopeptide (TPR) repeat protein